jgi:hypothetical protein
MTDFTYHLGGKRAKGCTIPIPSDNIPGSFGALLKSTDIDTWINTPGKIRADNFVMCLKCRFYHFGLVGGGWLLS